MAFGRRRPPLERRSDGAIVVGLEDGEREVIVHLMAQLRVLIQAETAESGPVGESSPVRRLFPTAHPGDAEREADYQAMVHGQLVEQRLASIETVEQTLDSDTITDEHASTWMLVFNDLRLVIGTKLDVSEDEIDMELDLTDPEAHLHAVYDYLGFLVDRLVTVLTQSLPEPD